MADGRAAAGQTYRMLADFPLALTDVRDTGAVGAHILADPAPHAGKTYEFTGKLTSNEEFAEAFREEPGAARSPTCR